MSRAGNFVPPPRTRARVEVAVLGFLAAAPIIASAARALSDWRPVGDTAAIALRASDVFGPHSPLVGMPTTLSDSLGQAAHHPGPLEFWAIGVGQLAADHRLTPMLVVAAINVVAVVAMVTVAGWMAGRQGRLLAALVLVLCTWSLRGEILIDPYNPYAAWLPLGTFAVAVIAATTGRLWALPIAGFAGSYAAQAHVSLLAPVGLVTVVAVAWAIGSWLQVHGSGRRLVEAVRSGICSQRLPFGATVAVLVVAWSPVAVDLVAGRQNLWVLVGAAGSDGEVVGWSRAWEVIARAITSPPWLTPDRSPFDTVAPVSGLRQVVATGVLAALVAAVVRRRRQQAVAAVAIAVAIAGLVAGMVATSRIPDTTLSVLALHNYLWLWPFTALLWVGAVVMVVSWGLDRVGGRSGGLEGRWKESGVVIQALAALLVLTVATVGWLQAPPRTSLLAERHGPATIAGSDQVASVIDPGVPVLIDVRADLEQSAVAMGMVFELERRGFDARVPSMWEGSFGQHRVHDDESPATVLVPRLGSTPPEPPAELDLELVASHDPDTEVLAELAEANRALLDHIEGAGGLILYDGTRLEDDDLARVVVTGALLGPVRLELVVSPDIPDAIFDRYARAQEGPVLYLRVFQVIDP